MLKWKGKKSMRRLLAAGLLIGLSACVNVSAIMKSWEGNHFSDLIASWGPPQQVMDDGQGGKIFVYASNRTFTSPGHATTTTTGSVYGSSISAYSTTTYTPPTSFGYTAYRIFWINDSGYIYRWAWKGY